MLACVLQHDYLGDNVLAARGLVHSRNAKLLVSDLEFSVLIMLPFGYDESHSVCVVRRENMHMRAQGPL